MTPEVSLSDIEAAADRLRGRVRRTPTLLFRPRPSLPGIPDEVEVYLKLEHLQGGGSFKLRGATNALLLAGDAARRRGVFTASGGNHGIGVALAARGAGVPATVYLPETAPRSSEEALLRLGARVLRGGAAWDDAWARCQAEAEASGGLLIHPFDDPAVIAGQGTVGLELLADVPDVDLLLVAVGGGGLLSGVATAVRARTAGRARVVGVEPTGADAMRRSLLAGRPVRLARVETIAGTLAPLSVSARTLRLCQAHCAGVILCSDDELRAAQAMLWDELRLRLEPAGAATAAALSSGRLGEHTGGVRTVALLLCGANA